MNYSKKKIVGWAQRIRDQGVEVQVITQYHSNACGGGDNGPYPSPGWYNAYFLFKSLAGYEKAKAFLDCEEVKSAQVHSSGSNFQEWWDRECGGVNAPPFPYYEKIICLPLDEVGGDEHVFWISDIEKRPREKGVVAY